MAGFDVREADAVRMVPHPAVTLLIDFGTASPTVDYGAGLRRRGSMVAGPGFGAGGAVWAHGLAAECVQVRLSPVIARAVLGIDPGDLDEGAAIALDDVWGRPTTRLRERLAAMPWQERFAALEALIAGRLAAARAADPEVVWAWKRIVAAGGALRIERLADEVGWSRKRLWSRFGTQLGVAPKRAAKLVRFDRAAHRLVAGDSAARVAAVGGFADQSHLHRDVRDFIGVTPAAVPDETFLAVDHIAWDAHPPSRR
jgi:AraC-like DNA-binding protein